MEIIQNGQKYTIDLHCTVAFFYLNSVGSWGKMPIFDRSTLRGTLRMSKPSTVMADDDDDDDEGDKEDMPSR